MLGPRSARSLIHSVIPALTLLQSLLGHSYATPHHRLRRVGAGITLYITASIRQTCLGRSGRLARQPIDADIGKITAGRSDPLCTQPPAESPTASRQWASGTGQQLRRAGNEADCPWPKNYLFMGSQDGGKSDGHCLYPDRDYQTQRHRPASLAHMGSGTNRFEHKINRINAIIPMGLRCKSGVIERVATMNTGLTGRPHLFHIC